MYTKKIFKKIRTKNIVNLLFPAILSVLIAFFYFNHPIHDVLAPVNLEKISDVSTSYNNNKYYIDITVDKLYSTGLDYTRNGRRIGHYYYAFEGNYCYIFLLSDEFLKDYTNNNSTDTSVLNNIDIHAKILSNPKPLRDVISHISHELSWTYNGINNSTSGYVISELDYPYNRTFFVAIILTLLGLLSITCIIYSIICICCPYLDKSVIKLIHYGNIKSQIMQAGKELEQKISLKEGNFIITENYLMDFSKYNFQIIPLNRIIWAYKFSSYHPARRGNHKITYTLSVYGQYNTSIISPYCNKPHIDKVLDFLRTQYPYVLFGYSREHERTAKLRIKNNNRKKTCKKTQ